VVTNTANQKKHPPCFRTMYELGEAEMVETCLICPHFNQCEKESPSSLDITPISIMFPRELDIDHEYAVRW